MKRYERRWLKHLPVLIGILLALLIAGAVYYLQSQFEKPVQSKKQVQQIVVVQPPPPPPKIEKPPEPEKIEEKIEPVDPEPEPEPENLPDVDDTPPAGDLGLDADGSVGSDGFGLVARKGGKGLLSGNPNAWYGNIIRNQMLDLLSSHEELRRTRYSATVRLWVNREGNVKRFELIKSSNDPEVDKSLQLTLSKLKRISQAPPSGMTQPVELRITSRI